MDVVTVAAGFVALGLVLLALTFFAGGGGSVRGYAYRNIGVQSGDDVTGGRSLIEAILASATVPYVIDGDGNCHVYVDASADLAMAERIIVNAKVQRPGVCNAAETLLSNPVIEDVVNVEVLSDAAGHPAEGPTA